MENDEQKKGALDELMNTPDSTSEFDPQDIEKNKAFSILAYLGILCLLPLFLAKDSKFAKFHANQGLILFICEIIGVFIGFFPYIGWLDNIVGILCFILMIIGILNAAKGLAKELPLVGKFKLI